MHSLEHPLLPQDACLELYEGGSLEDDVLINLATHETHVMRPPAFGYHWVLDFDPDNGMGILDQVDDAGTEGPEDSVWAQELLQWCAYLKDLLSNFPVSLLFIDIC